MRVTFGYIIISDVTVGIQSSCKINDSCLLQLYCQFSLADPLGSQIQKSKPFSNLTFLFD